MAEARPKGAGASVPVPPPTVPVTTTTTTTPGTVTTTSSVVEPTKSTEISTQVTKTGVADNPAILTTELFGQNRVDVLESEDFKLTSEHPIDIIHKGCYLVLFHVNNEESKNLAIIWNSVAQQVPGPTFAAVNLLSERRIAKAFTDLNTNNSTYKTFRLKGVPFIIIYQNGSPIAFYNGERAVQPISDYALTLACDASNFEPLQLTAGMQTDNNIAMTGWAEYDNTRKVSIDYKTDSNIRKYDPTKKPVIVGSAAFTQEGREVAEREALEGITRTEEGTSAQAPRTSLEEAESANIEGVTSGASPIPAPAPAPTEQVVSPK